MSPYDPETLVGLTAGGHMAWELEASNLRGSAVLAPFPRIRRDRSSLLNFRSPLRDALSFPLRPSSFGIRSLYQDRLSFVSP